MDRLPSHAPHFCPIPAYCPSLYLHLDALVAHLNCYSLTWFCTSDIMVSGNSMNEVSIVHFFGQYSRPPTAIPFSRAVLQYLSWISRLLLDGRCWCKSFPKFACIHVLLLLYSLSSILNQLNMKNDLRFWLQKGGLVLQQSQSRHFAYCGLGALD